jgi:biopolymer transport protein TolQ
MDWTLPTPPAHLFIECLPLAGILDYYAQSNFAGKVIIILLIFTSLVAWTVMIGKYMDLSKLRNANNAIEERLGATERVLRIDPKLGKAKGPYAAVAREALAAYHRARGGTYAVGHVENALQRSVARESMRYETKMILLGSIVTGAPFMGLLGTVWGVMDAFGAITGQASANIGALAPGVSGALLTTVAGLVVAIPSVFGYNFLLTQVKMMITELENFASNVADRIELEAKGGDPS